MVRAVAFGRPARAEWEGGVIRVFTGGFSNTIWAAPRVRERGDGLQVVVGRKDDVTYEAIVAVREHMAACEVEACICKATQARMAEYGGSDPT